jgi:hypothetical protein
MTRFPRLALQALTTALILASTAGCRRKESFPDIGDTIASPVDLALTADEKYVFVLNADFDRTYNQGSIITMDTDGNKLNVIKVPRMGRSLTVAGDVMLVTIDQQNEDNNTDTPPELLLFDISDPVHPALKQTWLLPASPFNTTMRAGYPYFALSCLDGSLFIGDTENGLDQATLKYVRTYGQPRRALYIDPKRELLFGFTTDTTKGLNADNEYIDIWGFAPSPTTHQVLDPSKDPTDPLAQIPDEVPDIYQGSTIQQTGTSFNEVYQFFMYDFVHEKTVEAPPTTTPASSSAVQINIMPLRTQSDPEGCRVQAGIEDCHFPFRQSTDPYEQDELRWIYFRLSNFDGSPDRSPAYNNPGYRFYRTNFFSAEPDPDDPDAFYLSQRGSPDRSPWANQIVRVKFTGDPHAYGQAPTQFPNNLLQKWVPFTDTFFSFERVYGFRGPEATRSDYPGSFKVARVGGQKIVVVNNFRDLVNWVKDDWYFSLGAQTLDHDASWFAEQVGDVDPQNPTTYYQVALTSTGRLISLAFYGNAVMLLDVVPGVGINVVKRIE